MSDEIRELRSEINALKGSVGMEEENETSKTGNSQEEPAADSTIAIPSLQSVADAFSDFELEETELYVPNWLIEVLAFIYRKEMANSLLSTTNKIFQLLCWPKLHQKVKTHKIPNLYCSAIGGNRAQFQRLDTWEIIPIASTPAPHYINGFGTIALRFVNEQVMDFIKSIARLLQNCDDLCVFFRIKSREMDKKLATSIHPLLEYLANKIFKFTISYYGIAFGLNDFNGLFPGILDQIQFLSVYTSQNIDGIDTTLNWLTNQSNGGKQKIIELAFPEQDSLRATFINRIKEEFSNSNLPSNFLIAFFDHLRRRNVEEFTLENVRTNEVLTFYRGRFQYYIARYPKGEEHWKEYGQNKIRKVRSPDSSIIINA